MVFIVEVWPGMFPVKICRPVTERCVSLYTWPLYVVEMKILITAATKCTSCSIHRYTPLGSSLNGSLGTKVNRKHFKAQCMKCFVGDRLVCYTPEILVHRTFSSAEAAHCWFTRGRHGQQRKCVQKMLLSNSWESTDHAHLPWLNLSPVRDQNRFLSAFSL